MLEGAKSMGAGAATIASAGAAVGIGNVLSSSIHSVARNPSLAKQSFGYAILGFALTEAIASFAPMMAFLISSVFRSKKESFSLHALFKLRLLRQAVDSFIREGKKGPKHGGCRTLEWQRKARPYLIWKACSDIRFPRKIKLADKAAIKAMPVNRVGDFGLAPGISGCFTLFQTVDFSTIFACASAPRNSWISRNMRLNAITLICILLLIGAVGKSAQIGSHTWSPDAMEGPTPVSALIHAATMVTAGVFMIARCSPLFEYPPTALIVITFAGATTSFLAATTGILQNDLKRVIAYSTCSQLGYMIFACGISNYSVSVFHLMNHAFFKALLFLSAGSVIHAMSDEQDMRKMGFQTSFPFTYAMMLMGSLSLIGFPFLTGFYSKDVILELAYTKYTISGNFAFWHPGLRSRAPSLRGREENGSSLVIEGRAMLVLRVRICYLATIKGMPLSPVREGGGGVSYRPILDPAVHDAELPNMNTGKVKVGLHSSIRAGLRMLLVQRVKEADQEPIALGHHSFKSSPQPMIWYMVGLQLRRILHIQGRHSTKGFGADEDKDVLLFGIDYYHSTADVEMTKPCHASGPIFLFKNKKGTEPRLMTKGESETYNDTTPRTIHPGHKAGKSDTKEIFPYWTPIQYSILKRPKKEKRRMRPSSFFNEPHPGSFFRSVVGSPVRKLKVRRRREDWKAGVSQPCFCSPFISTRSDCPIVPKPLLTLPVRHSVHSAYRAKAFRNRPSIERWNQKHNGKWEIGLELRSQDWELRRFKRKPVKSFTSAYQAESDPKEKEPLSP
ncbi:hypothetical protein Acr_00g0001380 [Actinidia rufa]|uniref:ATP synthase subunit 9, mitochondrial n=5 Tax=Mesangiospermae TaxID=1437183 RepID=A0A7J0D6J5_9ERIC|nr:hypothetical protein Acr_00g0001380 [Actinidia rufa]